jgi:molecular chaperone IbpA
MRIDDMNRFDLTPYRRTTVGFDRLFELIENSGRLSQGDNYPPFNIERTAEDDYTITLAVAGFKQEEIDITAQPNQLIVAGSKAPESTDGREFLHVGIANRNFERRFQLADYIRVLDADLADGILVITLRREIPEALKPRKVAIGGTVESNVTQIESAKEAKDGDSKAA